MNKKFVNNFFLSNYSLITQIIIINIITAFIGLIFVCVFNYLLLNNNTNIEKKVSQINQQIYNIKNYLEENAIIKIPLFNEENGDIIFSEKPQLDPYISQLFLENHYLNQPNEILIYNSELIKYVDIKELYKVDKVVELELGATKKEKKDLIYKYKEFYKKIFSKLQNEFDKKKVNKLSKNKIENDSIIENTISEGKEILKIFVNENNSLFFNFTNPLFFEKKVYGAVLIKGSIEQEINESATISFNLFNLYLIIITFMFLISIIFTRSIIRPIRVLSNLTKAEQRLNISLGDLNYPIRNDEIGGLSNDIKNMSNVLKSQIKELENFAADVSHELKNPLSSLKTSNELLAENKIDSKEKKILFNNIINDLNRMNKIISDISDFTRSQAEVEQQQYEKIDLDKFIEDLILSFSPDKKQIRIIFESKKQSIFIRTNIDKLAQVFINIIENAISFSPVNSKIKIIKFTEKGKVVVYFADQGHGIDQKLKEKIFERFYTDRENKDDLHTGLGLSISKKIIESLGGSLELSDNIIEGYKGACFKLELPIKD